MASTNYVFATILHVGDGHIAVIIDLRGGIHRSEWRAEKREAENLAISWAQDHNLDYVDELGRTA